MSIYSWTSPRRECREHHLPSHFHPLPPPIPSPNTRMLFPYWTSAGYHCTPYYCSNMDETRGQTAISSLPPARELTQAGNFLVPLGGRGGSMEAHLTVIPGSNPDPPQIRLSQLLGRLAPSIAHVLYAGIWRVAKGCKEIKWFLKNVQGYCSLKLH